MFFHGGAEGVQQDTYSKRGANDLISSGLVIF